MADVVQVTERLCRVPTPKPGGDAHAHAADDWVAVDDRHAARDRCAGVYRAGGGAEVR